MEKWMVVLVAAGFLIPYGTVLAVTGNIHGAEYVVGRIPAIGTGSSDLAGQ